MSCSCLLFKKNDTRIRDRKKSSVPEFIDPVFTKTSPKRSFSLHRKRAFWLVFAKTGSIISGTGLIHLSNVWAEEATDRTSAELSQAEFIAQYFFLYFLCLQHQYTGARWLVAPMYWCITKRCVNHYIPRALLNICRLPDPPQISLVTPFKKLACFWVNEKAHSETACLKRPQPWVKCSCPGVHIITVEKSIRTEPQREEPRGQSIAPSPSVYKECGPSLPYTRWSNISWARIFKRVWSPGIDSKEWILPAYVALQAGTITLFLLGS
jgi:hypothetical protein